MRVAILFSGQPRCVDGISYEGFRKCILERYNVDVYAHFWSDIETDKSTGSIDANIETFKKLYNPVAIQIDKPLTGNEYPLDFIQPHSPSQLTQDNILGLTSKNWAYWVRNCVSMYTSMKRVYQLFQSVGRQYDWIVRTRTDCVLLRCPRFEKLNTRYMYAPNWHGPNSPVIVNHALIVPPRLAPVLFQVRDRLETLDGKMDEEFIFNQFKQSGYLRFVRTLPMGFFYPTLTRNGIETDKPEPRLRSEITHPPYQSFMWETTSWKPQ